MNKPGPRKELRLSRSRKATLVVLGASSPCVIQDFSTKGFLIMSMKPFSVGDILDLRSELYPDQFLECKIEVRHITDDCLGTRITEISPRASRLYDQFLEEHYSDRLKFSR